MFKVHIYNNSFPSTGGMQNALNVFTNRTYVSNLKPICQNCNSSMGTKNMDEFMKSLK